MLKLKVLFTLLLMGSIPMWIRLVDTSSLVIGLVRLSLGLGLTVAVFSPKIDFSLLVFKPGRQADEGASRKEHRKLSWLLLSIGLLFGLHWYTYFESIQRSSATLGILALSTYGIHVTWMGAIFSERRPSARDWGAVALSALGAWVCVPTPDADSGAFVGFLLGLLSALFYASLPLLHQKAARVALPTRATAQFFFGLLIFLPSAPVQNWALDSTSWLVLVILGVFCTFIAHNLWISITTEVRPATSGLLYYLAIPITIVLETLVLSSPPTASQLLGAALILFGNGYALYRRGKTSA